MPENQTKSCGVLNLDKPIGVTSRDVVNQVVRLVHPAKVGHAGTLDPLATGVLVVCVGHATRLISLAQEGRKRYLGRFTLGQRSDTDDVTGNLSTGGDWSGITRNDLVALLPEFTGRILQIPPQFSAVHVNGQRAYDLARRGEAVTLEPRPVDIGSIELVTFEPPDFELEIECGSGTYVRSIGRDLGERLGCGAVMKALRRTAVGPFDVSTSVSADKLTRDSLAVDLQPALTIVPHLVQRRLSDEEVIAIRRGQSIRALPESHPLPSTTIEPAVANDSDRRTALIDVEGVLVGIAEFDPQSHRLLPRIVFPDC